MILLYLVVKAVAMEVSCVYVHLIAHTHQVPVYFVSHLHI